MKEKRIADELIDLLNHGNAHVPLDSALDGIPFERISETTENLPYNLWSLAEHLRIAQWDIVQFCKSAEHQSPEWPKEYWPANKKPTKREWDHCLKQIKADRNEMISLIRENENDLLKPFNYGSGQSLFREALVLLDHNSYHCGEIIAIRRLLGLWK